MTKLLKDIIMEMIVDSKIRNHPKIAIQILEIAVDEPDFTNQLEMFDKAVMIIDTFEKNKKEKNNE